MTNQAYIKAIKALKKEKNAVLLAHYYQVPEIQDLGDYVGDSLALAQAAQTTQADIIVFAGVHFMAETAKILNPSKKVLLPDLKAGCSLADSCPPDEFGKFVAENPNHTVISYVNCSAAVKGYTDIVVTSSNAKKILDSLPKDEKIIFAPDKNLGAYLNKITGRNMLLWEGSCMVHESFSLEKMQAILQVHPDAKIIAHPESEAPILQVASFVGSTSALLKYVKQDSGSKYIVATETGIFHQMKKDAPDKILIESPMKDNATCACSECFYMKMNTLEKLYLCLEKETPEIDLSEETIKKALPSMERMLSLS